VKSYLEAIVSADVDLSVHPFTILANKFVGVSRVTVFLVVTVGSSTVREEDHDLMDRLRILREVVLKSQKNNISNQYRANRCQFRNGRDGSSNAGISD